MSEKFSVTSHKHTYEVCFRNDFENSLNEHLVKGDVLIIDANILELYSDKLKPFLKSSKHIIIEASEKQKSYQALVPIIDDFIKNGFRKNNRFIAIGGGITQDITSFTASILFRGVDWIFFPTTLLAQCDSCIGSKTSINFGKYKNQLGGFHPPIAIVIDLGFLDTLKELDFRSGMGEMLHYYLISGEEDFKRISTEYDFAFKDKSILRNLIYHSLDFKRRYVERDEFDKGPRNIFNYGHSFGHAIETLTDYKVPHGIAVSFGMDIANHISEKLGYISEEERMRMHKILNKNWKGIYLNDINVNDFITALRKDKKAVGSEIHVILTRGIGQMFKMPLKINEQSIKWISDCLESFHA